MSDVERSAQVVPKGFSFQRLAAGRVKVRVKVGEVDMNAGFETADPIGTPVFREVILSAAEWADVVAQVSVAGGASWQVAVDLHMGPAEGDGL